MNFLLELGSSPKDIAVYIIGIGCLVTFVLSFQMKKRKNLLILQTISLILFGVQYFLLGAYTAVILEVLCITRNVIYYYRDKVKWFNTVWTPVVFVILAGCTLTLTFGQEGWWALIPVGANMIQTVGLYLRKEIPNRLFFLAGSPCWLVYNIHSNSLFGVITEVLNIISIIISVIRLVIAEKKEKKATEDLFKTL